MDIEWKSTPLHSAAYFGHPEVAKLLLGHEAQVNARNKAGTRPLHLAALQGHLQMAKLLLEKGADVNAQNEKGKAALHFTACTNQTRVAKLLLKADGVNEALRDQAIELILLTVS